ncbi:Bug family tripartite tricarboxylate transporter substrate binding protein [Cupriavidus taiwanensis]|uniref:Protein BugT n=1 Tax=Cupriavidus taiwanensis TaxID=164546 RepID=A0A7Z7NP32_9BURK|nr:tripartite tricarboxylate transporter substrate binding protein [Cupriavidus taiwanensis]SOZ08643.1 conserved hypothetical protein, UPF0065 [Cupriavidus taiwanensis]SOZ10978.1 conserved hypothetical protein, UPF0065 [Cupriavidus taiwanensis]SOZ42303.1 conserved hypothetical protein, UPF0065 [Cupriavidus taiwanensis]SPC21342.1 conserved hypothetical protein, UPF0065 [Cupriavidus taiwanensis]SPD55481.1 conserved exported protein of unknown function [Cupriavidus taiwanensis]
MKTIAHALAATCLTLATSVALAGPYPDKPIRMVVPFPPGGTTDLLGRVLATRLSETLGQQVVVDNRPGAGGTIGSDLVAKSPADGYTLMFGTVGTQSINATLYKKLPFDPQKDFSPVALFAGVPNILVVNPNVPARNVRELVSYAKANPGKLNMGSAGNGTTNHLSGELFKSMAGVQVVHVPYKGSGPAMADLLANQVQLMFDNLPGSLPHVKAGRLRALAVTSATRSPALPDVPTMAEAGIAGYEADVWFGVVGPRGLPPEVSSRLSQEITRIAQDKAMRDKLVQAGDAPLTSTPEQFSVLIRRDTDKWAKLVQASGASVD